MYSLVNGENEKNYLMGFVYRVVWVLKALSITLSETVNFWEIYHRVMYIAPSSGHISLNFNMPLKWILRRFDVVLWCLEWEYRTFERLMEIHSNPPYYTLALNNVFNALLVLNWHIFLTSTLNSHTTYSLDNTWVHSHTTHEQSASCPEL